MGPTWVLSGPGGPHVGPMILAIRDVSNCFEEPVYLLSYINWDVEISPQEKHDSVYPAQSVP